MKLSEILMPNNEALNYMERLVNKGSKSGFTTIHTSSMKTNPFYSESFRVKKLFAVSESVIETYGSMPSFCYTNSESIDFIYMHPDWSLYHEKEICSLGNIIDGEIVIPTSSMRTVRIKGTNYYLKLCYPDKLGRLKRDLNYPHLISAIEVTESLNHLKNSGRVPDIFGFMPETGGKILKKGDTEIGFVVREIGIDIHSYYLVPAFSLFSPDIKNPNDECLLIQLLRIKRNPIDFLLEDICYPLIDIFFSCAFNEGLIPEMHSQNILYAFDAQFNVKKVVLRDFESVDKDVSIRSKLGLPPFVSYPYKCICKSDKYYLKRHSLMFDHKLCEYLIDPMVKTAAIYLDINIDKITNAIRHYVNEKMLFWNEPFFPDDHCWYKYPDIEIDRSTDERPFVKYSNLTYRG